MPLPGWLTRILGFLLAVLIPIVSLLFVPFTRPVDPASAKLQEQLGGFVCGICHTEPDYEKIKAANIDWLREDIPYPFDFTGAPSQYYQDWKSEIQDYVDHGIRILGITPYPKDFLFFGLDVRDEEDLPRIREVAQFLVNDLRDLVDGFQITNEMGVERFTDPLTMDEAATFIGVQLEAMAPIKGDKIIGYNLGGPGYYQLAFKMLKYNKYCDYIGCDLYLGSFDNIIKNIDTYFAVLNAVRAVTQKPIIMMEFGYIGYGEPKTREEKNRILQRYGYDSEEDVAKDVDGFIRNLPPRLGEEFLALYGDRSDEEKCRLLFNSEYAYHIYCELPEGTGLYGYPHTPEGQAKFFSYLIPKFRQLPWIVGAFVYMWEDSEYCYVCGQPDCPVETGWGIVDGAGNPKPAYYAVQKAFAD